MSIDLNNAQFRKFVSFADEADSYNAIAQIGEVKGHNASGVLQNRKIEAKSQLDWVGNVLRFSKSRTTNNAVRELFLNTVLKHQHIDFYYFAANIRTISETSKIIEQNFSTLRGSCR